MNDSSFHELEPVKSLEECSLSESSSKNQVKSLQNISLSTVEGDLKTSFSSKVDSLVPDDILGDAEKELCLPKFTHKKQPAKRNLISRFESLALDNDSKNYGPTLKDFSENKVSPTSYYQCIIIYLYLICCRRTLMSMQHFIKTVKVLMYLMVKKLIYKMKTLLLLK